MALSSICIFATLGEVKPWLKLAETDVAADVVLEQLCNSVTEELEALTDRIFLTRSVTETRSGDGGTRLVLRRYPVTTVTTFTVDGTAILAADYFLDADAGIIELQAGQLSATEPGNIALAYTAGYARASIPARVVQVAREMVAFRYGDWTAGANSAESVNYGVQGYTPRSSWPYHVKDALDKLRREHRVNV